MFCLCPVAHYPTCGFSWSSPNRPNKYQSSHNLFISSFITNTYHAIRRQNRTWTIWNFLIRWTWLITCLRNYLVPRNWLIRCLINQSFKLFTLPNTIWRSQWPRGWRCGSVAARLLRLRIRIPPRVWLSLVNLCCQIEVSAMGRSLVQRSPTECGVSSVISKPQRWGSLGPSGGVQP